MTDSIPTYKKPSELLLDIDSHGIYNARILKRCRFDTSMVSTFDVAETLKNIEQRGLGGFVEAKHEQEKLIYGWVTASNLAYHYLGEDPGKQFFGRGSSFRACYAALRDAGF